MTGPLHHTEGSGNRVSARLVAYLQVGQRPFHFVIDLFCALHALHLGAVYSYFHSPSALSILYIIRPSSTLETPDYAALDGQTPKIGAIP